MDSSVACTVDLDAPGRSLGHLVVPWSRDGSGWGNLLTPIAVVAGGDGPTVLLTGGSHGDEFEGPVALRRLVRTLRAEDLHGRVLVVPQLSQAATRAGTRLSPIDGGNMNRSFPGAPDGTVTERIADFVYRELVQRADVVLDIHSGGTSMMFDPFVATHELAEDAQAEATMGYVAAFGTALAVLMTEPDPHGLLDTAVEDLGKVFLTTEIGGGGVVTARSTGIAYSGAVNTLRHAGVLDGAPDVDGQPRVMRMIDGGAPLAPHGGLLEPRADVGDEPHTGDVVACVHPFDDLTAEPSEIVAPAEGYVLMRHCAGRIAAGDPVVALAEVHETVPQPAL